MNIEDKRDKQEMARSRGNVYGLLAAFYRQEVTSDFLKKMKTPDFQTVLASFGIQSTNGFFQKPEEELLEELAVEYTRLFVGPGRHISPHESAHLADGAAGGGMLWGEATAEVKKFIESAGLEYEVDFKGMPDHISVEMEFMQQAALREARAWEEEDGEGALCCRRIEKKFIDDHLDRWIAVFCVKVVKEAKLPLYEKLAGLTNSFIEFEKKELGDRSIEPGRDES